jgi:hypothetical protein
MRARLNRLLCRWVGHKKGIYEYQIDEYGRVVLKARCARCGTTGLGLGEVH